MIVSLFLVILGLIAISIGIRTYLHFCSTRVMTGGELVDKHPVFILQDLTEGDMLVSFPARPLWTLAFIMVIGLLPLSFGVLLLVRMMGLF